MAKEYISREAATVCAPLPKYLRNYQTENLDDAWEDGYDYAISQIDAIPAADVVEVRHGRWNGGATGWECSVCSIESNNTYPHCPYCGAVMDGGQDE